MLVRCNLFVFTLKRGGREWVGDGAFPSWQSASSVTGMKHIKNRRKKIIIGTNCHSFICNLKEDQILFFSHIILTSWLGRYSSWVKIDRNFHFDFSLAVNNNYLEKYAACLGKVNNSTVITVFIKLIFCFSRAIGGGYK